MRRSRAAKAAVADEVELQADQDGVAQVVHKQDFGDELRAMPAVTAPSMPNMQQQELNLGAGFDAVVERVYSIDIEQQYGQVERGLRLSMRASSATYGEIIDATQPPAPRQQQQHRRLFRVIG